MKRLIWILTGIAISASLIVAIVSFRSAQRSGTAASELANHNKHLAAEIADALQRLALRTQDEEALRLSLQQARSKKEQSSPAAGAKSQAASTAPLEPPRRDLADLMDANPALRTLFKQSVRANLGMQYLPWYGRAHLSSVQIEKFEDLMTEAEQDRLDVQTESRAQGLAPNDPAVAKMQQQAEKKLQSAQKEILGDAGYLSLQQYNRLQPLVGFTTSVASDLAYAGNPLSAPQVDLLLDVLGNASNQYQTGGRADPVTVDSKRVLQQAEQTLTPIQFAAVQATTNQIELMKLQKQFYQQKKTDVK